MSTIKSLRYIAFIFSLLSLHILTACSATEVKVKNYSSTSCPSNDSNMKPDKNVASLASGYYVIYATYHQANFSQVNLNGRYATGQSEVSSKSFNSKIQARLTYDQSTDFPVKMVSLVEMPQPSDTSQALYFSAACQLSNAYSDNSQLQKEPVGAFYLLASQYNFITLGEDAYTSDPLTKVKFTLLNASTNKTETAVFYLGEILDKPFTPPAPSLVEQIQNFINKNDYPQWKLQKRVRGPLNESYYYFSITKDIDVEPMVGQILNIEFVPPEEK
jgi:hypothetical protein